MQVKEFDLVELKTGRFGTVLDIFTAPSLGYLIEDVDYDLQDYPIYDVLPKDIKRVIDDPEEAKRITAALRQRTLDYIKENGWPLPED
jgi:hypothetical protein